MLRPLDYSTTTRLCLEGLALARGVGLGEGCLPWPGGLALAREGRIWLEGLALARRGRLWPEGLDLDRGEVGPLISEKIICFFRLFETSMILLVKIDQTKTNKTTGN